MLHAAQDHMRQARMQPEPRHRAAMRRHLALGIQGVEFDEKLAGLAKGGLGQRVEPGELLRFGGAPAGEFEHQGREVGGKNLGQRVPRQGTLLGLRP